MKLKVSLVLISLQTNLALVQIVQTCVCQQMAPDIGALVLRTNIWKVTTGLAKVSQTLESLNSMKI